ncbi:DUF1806 family protein [Ammoniphilus sp. 3BR4]|uniref:DUF1806 family protein n=1 Tax=Ammoniphilus sp. 3BR4 TaxID=3158265 RepID=UPI0034662E16
MKSIQLAEVQEHLHTFAGKTCHIHLETTQGAYDKHPIGCFIRNAQVQVERAQIRGTNPYRVGLKIPLGWVYAEGLNVFDWDERGRLLLEGHDDNGKLQVALHIHLNAL